MIGGKLSELGRKPPNVLLLIEEPEVGGEPRLSLQDEEGVFLTADKDSLDPEWSESEEDGVGGLFDTAGLRLGM